ncbi:MAG: VanZ family protein [Gammaproteobacteria bacterium]|nr:VanZ family protein [Gammaproteobacteria bacterium]
MTMYRLQFPRLWLGLGWALVMLVVVGSLLPGKMLESVDFLLSDKIQHALAYATVMVWFAGIYQASSYRWMVPGLLVMGIGLEYLQLKYFHRHFDLRDMLANGVGVVTGLVLARFGLGGWCARLENWWRGRRSADSGGG